MNLKSKNFKDQNTEKIDLESEFTIVELEKELEYKQYIIDSLYSSWSWKVSSPLRLATKIPFVLLNNKQLHQDIPFAISLLKREGFGSFMRRLYWYIRGKRLPFEIPMEGADALQRLSMNDKYQLFLKNNILSAEDILNIKKESNEFEYKPLLSIITPVFNVDPKWLDKCIHSVLGQYYENWELCLHDDASTSEETKTCLQKWADLGDKRIKISYGKKNLHIAGASNEALKIATGEYVCLLDNDDEISSEALYEVIKCINNDKTVDFIYTDKDKLDEDGNHFDPFVKPDWSPELMYSANYLTHLNIIRTSLLHKIGGWDISTNGAQDWDLFLRVADATQNIKHIPRILYHWRVHRQSTAFSIDAKPYAIKSQEFSLNKHFKTNAIPAKVEVSPFGEVKIEWQTSLLKNLSKLVFVVTGDYLQSVQAFIDKNVQVLETFNNSKRVFYVQNEEITFNDYKGFQSLGGEKKNTLTFMRKLAEEFQDSTVIVLDSAISHFTYEHIVHLAGWASLKGVGAVGGVVTDNSNRITDMGQIIGLGSTFGYMFRGLSFGQAGHLGHSNWLRNMNIVSTKIFALSPEALKVIKKINPCNLQKSEEIPYLMLKLRYEGMRNIACPMVLVKEKLQAMIKGIPSTDMVNALEEMGFWENDEYFNENLSLKLMNPTIVIDKNLDRPDLKMMPYLTSEHLDNQKIQTEEVLAVRAEISQLNYLDIDLDNFAEYQWVINPNAKEIGFFLPAFDTVYAGINNILRFAEELQKRGKNITFYVMDIPEHHESKMKKIIKNHNPSLSKANVYTITTKDSKLRAPIDMGIATLWVTAYVLLKIDIKQKAYFIQDDETMFYAGGVMHALAEQTYKFGFFGIANTKGLLEMYEKKYKGKGIFVPSEININRYLDSTPRFISDAPYRVLFYGRPGNPRNAFGLGVSGLTMLKKKFGENISIYSAGADWNESDYNLQGIITNLGKVPFSELPALYSSMDVGIMFMYSGHPGVVASELMAAGVPVVVNKHNEMIWNELYRNEENCLLCYTLPSSIVHNVSRLLEDLELRKKLIVAGRKSVTEYYGKYQELFENGYDMLFNMNNTDIK